MNAIILAAGAGIRLGTLTHHVPKPLIPIANKPILWHLIESLAQCGIRDFIFAVGHLKNQVIAFLNEIQKKDFNFTIEFAKDYSKGPLYSFSACLSENKEEDFILVPADLLIDPNALAGLLRKSEKGSLTVMFDEERAEASCSRLYLSSADQASQVVGFTSKMIEENAFTGLLVPLLISRVDFQPYVQKSMELNQTKVIDAMQLFLENENPISAYKIQGGYWFDLDTIEDVLTANQFFLEQGLYKGRTPINSDQFDLQYVTIRNPVLLGDHCKIDANCIIGPNVAIGDHSVIRQHVNLQNAIVFPRSTVPANREIRNAIFFKKGYH